MDISGRHRTPDGKYRLVCAAIGATLTPFSVHSIMGIKIIEQEAEDLSFGSIADIVSRAAARLDGVLITEHGEFYGAPAWKIESALGRKFRYAESAGERRALEIAHHVSLAARRLLEESG